MKTNDSVYNAHLDFRGRQVFDVVNMKKKCCSDHCWCNFRHKGQS